MMRFMRRHTFTRLGEAALMVQSPLARELLVSLHESPLAGVTEVVPALNVVTVLFQPEVLEAATLQEQLNARLHGLTPQPPEAGRHLVLPVTFDGPDLAWCAEFTGQSVEAFLDEVCSVPLTVAFLGYTPGFAFLTGLPQRLQMPRLSAPRERVPAGSVALGGPWAGAYPLATPGGWRLVGRTAIQLFDLSRADPVWWQPGDVVRFQRA